MATVSRVVDHRALAVATRAAEQALARGIELSDALALWGLAGGRPSVEPVAGDPDELGALLEASIDPDRRRAGGVHHTPSPLAAAVAERALAGHARPTVCDLACGGGALLLAAARHLATLGEDPTEIITRLWGADLDPLAVATTEVALTLWAGVPPPEDRFVVADTILEPPAWGPFDVIVGNPPFLSQLAASTTRAPAESAALRERFGGSVGAYTDAAAVSLLVGTTLLATGGTLAMVQPQSVLGARDGAGIRAAVESRATVREVWAPPTRAFDASVEVCVVVLDEGPPPRPPGPWSAHLARAQGVPGVELAVGGTTLGDLAAVAAAFRSEYYGMAEHVHEADDLPGGTPLLTSGLVDLGSDAWGVRPARMAGRQWERPVIDVDALEGRARRWAQRAREPKLVVATQTRVVEVVVDAEGRFIPGVPLVVAWADADRLWSLAAVLASPPINAWSAAQVAGTALSPSALKLTASMVRAVPLPADVDAWSAGAAALEHGEAEPFAEAMTAAYGCSSQVAAWWLGRLGSVWRPAAPSR